jgi:uncharacterized membrane protein
MTRAEFLRELDAALGQLPAQERQKQQDFYAEMLDDMREDGISEEAAVEKLGDPRAAAEKVLQELPLPALVKSRVRPSGGWTAATIVLLVLGSPIWFSLLIAVIAVVLAVYVVIWALIAALFAVVLSIGVAGLAVVAALLWAMPGSVAVGLMTAGAGIALLGLAVLAFVGAGYAARALVRLTGALAVWIRSLFIRRENGTNE